MCDIAPPLTVNHCIIFRDLISSLITYQSQWRAITSCRLLRNDYRHFFTFSDFGVSLRR